MGKLVFRDDVHFDGECVRFAGVDDGTAIPCGVTANALKYCNCGLPHYGLIPAEKFVSAYQTRKGDIHRIAAAKYAQGEFESDNDLRITVHRRDLVP